MMSVFVKLTRQEDGRPVYVNAAQVREVAESGGTTWVDMGDLVCVVKETAESVVGLLEMALKGGDTA